MVTVAAIAIGAGVVYLGWVCGGRRNGERRFTSHNKQIMPICPRCGSGLNITPSGGALCKNEWCPYVTSGKSA